MRNPKVPKYTLTEEEKERIVNELEELVNNPNISIRTEGIKDSFLKYKYIYTGKMELQWYRIVEDFIEVLKTKIE